ncbi:hypothetical protein [Streptomyces yerevanensis]|uniref:hypothetical protein n=1 Tax=Streptomyces yerevanensis TaxID=66378 RepID=UPI0012FF05A1|nr:hypothetical protein [Streptomyces yerevanensis]
MAPHPARFVVLSRVSGYQGVLAANSLARTVYPFLRLPIGRIGSRDDETSKVLGTCRGKQFVQLRDEAGHLGGMQRHR